MYTNSLGTSTQTIAIDFVAVFFPLAMFQMR
jgi:hypothetical protein